MQVKDPEMSDYCFTATFEKETFEQVITVLSKAASCSFRAIKNNVVLFKKK